MNLFEIVKYGVGCREAAAELIRRAFEDLGLIAFIVILAGLGYVSIFGVGENKSGSASSVKQIRRRCPLRRTASTLPTGRIL